jgi:hypothetical protein
MNVTNAVCEFLYDSLVLFVDLAVDLVFFALTVAAVFLPFVVVVVLGLPLYGAGFEIGPVVTGIGIVALVAWAALWWNRVDDYFYDRRDKFRLPKWKDVRKRI